MGGIPEEFLTVAEIAATLKVNEQTIRNWIEAGTLPAYHLGPARRRVRVSRDDFDRFLNQEQESSKQARSDDSITVEEFWSGGIHSPPQIPNP